MKSIHRIGLTIASLVAVVTVAGAFVVQGYVAAQQAAAQATTVNPAVQAAPAPTATQVPEIVYISPPTPATPAPAVAAVQPPAVQPAPVIHVIVPSSGGDDGGSDD
jgi:cytoskeletal protein RodZ